MSSPSLQRLPAELIEAIASSLPQKALLNFRSASLELAHKSRDAFVQKFVFQILWDLSSPTIKSKVDFLLAHPVLADLVQQIEVSVEKPIQRSSEDPYMPLQHIKVDDVVRGLSALCWITNLSLRGLRVQEDHKLIKRIASRCLFPNLLRLKFSLLESVRAKDIVYMINAHRTTLTSLTMIALTVNYGSWLQILRGIGRLRNECSLLITDPWEIRDDHQPGTRVSGPRSQGYPGMYPVSFGPQSKDAGSDCLLVSKAKVKGPDIFTSLKYEVSAGYLHEGIKNMKLNYVRCDSTALKAQLIYEGWDSITSLNTQDWPEWRGVEVLEIEEEEAQEADETGLRGNAEDIGDDDKSDSEEDGDEEVEGEGGEEEGEEESGEDEEEDGEEWAGNTVKN